MNQRENQKGLALEFQLTLTISVTVFIGRGQALLQ